MTRSGLLIPHAARSPEPSIAFAHGLQKAGHVVGIINISDVQGVTESAGLRCLSLAAAEYLLGMLQKTTKKIRALTGGAFFAYVLECMSLLVQTSSAYPDCLKEARFA